MKRTAREMLEELAMDPNYVAMKKRQDKEREAFEAELDRDEKPLVKALGEAGVRGESVWDLVNTSEPYPKAMPVLIEHLRGSYHPRTLEGIARSLAVRDPYAIEHAWPVALDLFLKATPDEQIKEPRRRGFKEGLAVMLSAICTEERLPQVFDLIRDPKHGDDRTHLIYGLRKFSTNKKVKEFLESLCEDSYWGELAQETMKGK
jgi:hypothetical protein